MVGVVKVQKPLSKSGSVLSSIYSRVLITLILMIILFATSAFIAYEGEQRKKTSSPPPQEVPQATIILPSPTPTSPDKSGGKEDLATACGAERGTWLAAYNECEGIAKETCNKLGGEYISCASACRHKPKTEVCIQVCVEVCNFK